MVAPALHHRDGFIIELCAALLRGLCGLEFGEQRDGVGLCLLCAASGGESARGNGAAGGFNVGRKFYGEKGRAPVTRTALNSIFIRHHHGDGGLRVIQMMSHKRPASSWPVTFGGTVT